MRSLYALKLRPATLVDTVQSMSRERLLVAKASEIQLQLAVSLLDKATANLTALRFGAESAAASARCALGDAQKALARIEILIKHIPE